MKRYSGLLIRQLFFVKGGISYGSYTHDAAAYRQRSYCQVISEIINYVKNSQKTDNGRLITGFVCDSRVADAESLLTKQEHTAITGRVRSEDDVIAYHVWQSFKPGEITPEEVNWSGVEFAKRFTLMSAD